MPDREIDPDIAAVKRLRDQMAADIRAQQQRLDGVDLALRILNATTRKAPTDDRRHPISPVMADWLEALAHRRKAPGYIPEAREVAHRDARL